MYILVNSIYQIYNLLFCSRLSFFTSITSRKGFELTKLPSLNYFVYLVGLHQIKNLSRATIERSKKIFTLVHKTEIFKIWKYSFR